MLEIVLTSAAVALCCSLGVHFVLSWETRVRLRRVEVEVADYGDRLQTEQKRRAGQSSVEARAATRLHPLDEAAVRAVTSRQSVSPQGAVGDDIPAWFDGLTRK